MQIVVGNGSKLFVGAYYRLYIDDQNSIDELNLSLHKLNEISDLSKEEGVAPKGYACTRVPPHVPAQING